MGNGISIRARLIILALLAIVPLMIDRALDAAIDRGERVASAHKQARALANRGVDDQNELLATTRAFLQVVGQSYPTFSGSRAACSAFLTKLRTGLPWTRAISVIDPSGTIICSSNAGSVGLNISDRPHFWHALKTGEFVVSNYLFGRRLTGPNIFALLPQRGADGSIEMFAAAVLDVGWISRLGSAVAEQTGAVMLMVDGAGTVISRHPTPEDWVGRRFKDHPLIRAMQGRPQGSLTAKGLDGVHRIFGFVQLPGAEARLAIGLDEREVLSRVNRAMWISFAQLGAISAIVLVGIWFGGERLFAKPIRELARAAVRVGQGEHKARAGDATWASEFVPLTSALNVMAGLIAKRERSLIKAKDHLEELSQIDALTQLANRRAFDSHLHIEWQLGIELGHPISLLMIDVDHFKLFNDRYGHVAGDDCLRAVGKALLATARTRTDLPARYGGEEFAILLPRVGLEVAAKVGERVRNAVEKLNIVHADTPAGRVSVSVGAAALVPVRGEKPQKLVEIADAALYAAKRGGRNTVVAQGAMTLAQAS